MRLNVENRGSGPRQVVLLHGLAADAATWNPLADLLAETATVHIPDLRGHGASPRARSYRPDEFAADLVESLPTRVDLAVGHSLGGSLLVRAAPALMPRHALYLDPGFRLGLPVDGWGARLFWAASPLTLGLLRRITAAQRPKVLEPGARELIAAAKARWDHRMAPQVFRALSEDPLPSGPPVVPSTILRSAQGHGLLPDPFVAELRDAGWVVRDVPAIGHLFHLESLGATVAAAADVLELSSPRTPGAE